MPGLLVGGTFPFYVKLLAHSSTNNQLFLSLAHISQTVEIFLLVLFTVTIFYPMMWIGIKDQLTWCRKCAVKCTLCFRNFHNSTSWIWVRRVHKREPCFLHVDIAFDRVWRDGLVYKMNQTNVTRRLIQLLDSYLRDQTFQVRMEKRTRTTEAGVPQGGVLSPILFSIDVANPPTQPAVKSWPAAGATLSSALSSRAGELSRQVEDKNKPC